MVRRKRQYFLLRELAKRGTRFLPNPNDDYHFSDFATLVRLGFTKLVGTIGRIVAKRVLGQGDWHASGDSSKAGLWCANRPKAEKDAEGRQLDFTELSEEESIPKPFLLEAVECELPNLDIVKLMIEKFHVDVNERTWGKLHTEDGNSLGYDNAALHSVAEGLHWWQVHQAMDYLLKVPRVDINLEIGSGLTPLHVAIGGRDHFNTLQHRPYSYDAVKRLLEAGADIHLKTKAGLSCLGLAMHNIEIIRLLIKHRAVISPKDIVAAVNAGEVDVLRELLHVKGKEGQDSASYLDPALHAAGSLFRKPDPEYGFYGPSVDNAIVLDMIRILIDLGADPLSHYCIRDKDNDKSGDSDYTFFKSGMPPLEMEPKSREETVLHSMIMGIENFHI